MEVWPTKFHVANISSLLKGVDAPFQSGTSAVNTGVRELFAQLDFQLKNTWDFIMYRRPRLSLVGVLDVAGAALDILIAKVLVQGLDLALHTIKIDRAAHVAYVVGGPQDYDIKITLIEVEVGSVLRWLEGWHQDIRIPDPRVPGGWIYRDDQDHAKRQGVILLRRMNRGLPLQPRIKLDGMLLQDMGRINLDQKAGEPLEYTVSATIDRVQIPLIF